MFSRINHHRAKWNVLSQSEDTQLHGSDFRQDRDVDIRESAIGVTSGHELPRRADPDVRATSLFECTAAAVQQQQRTS